MKTLRIMKIFLIILSVCILLNTLVYGYDYSSTITDLDSSAGDTTLNGKAMTIMGAIISVTRIIATGVAIIMLVVVSMKYMMSAPGDRADIKKHAVVYVVGALVLFGASGILTIIQNFATNI